jgi:membrane-bound lytic murein transglycosylase D
MSLRIRIFIVWVMVCGLAIGQNDIQLRLKTLEVRGLPFFYNQDIEQTVSDWLKNESESTSIFYGRMRFYGERIDRTAIKYGLPWFVKYIPAASSGYEPRYRDESGASGMWPLSYTIGKKYNLRQTALFDERRDPDKSTEAACLYLRDLYVIYGDWLKVITAFRIGPIRLNQVIHEIGGDLDFAHIYEALEPEERLPIIQFYAAVTVLHHAQQYGISPVAVEVADAMSVESINIVVPFAVLNEKIGVGLSDLRNLNPEFRADAVPFLGSTCVFKLPKSYAVIYNQKRDSLAFWVNSKPQISQRINKVDTLMVGDGDTAVGVAISKSDQSITDSTGVTPPLPKNIGNTPMESKVWVYYKVKSGDAVYTLSDIFDCTPEQMKSWNHLQSNQLKVGALLKFYVPVKRKSYYLRLNTFTIAQKRNIAGND